MQQQQQQQQQQTQAYNTNYACIGQSFAQHFYSLFDNGRNNDTMKQHLKELYHPAALLTFENEQVSGQDNIMTKILSMPCQKIVRHLTKVDVQPMSDGKVFVMTIGLMRSDDDLPLSFADSFVLQAFGGDNYFIINQIFRLVVHDIAL